MGELVKQRPIVIIEDSNEDFEVIVWALRQAGVSNPVFRCAKAIEIAGLLTVHSQWPRGLAGAYPILVMMDLNLPGTDWRETLADLRSNFWWQPVPVIILSTSNHSSDVSTCYRMGAAGYLQKPLDLDDFVAVMRSVAAYWLKTVVPPVPDSSLGDQTH